MSRSAAIDPKAVETWIFDLDNTLYPASSDLFRQIDRRILAYMEGFLGVGRDAAQALKRRYFLEHGSSMRGLMINDGMDPGAFLAYVHDIDLSPIGPSPALDEALARLPGRKLVHTNGSTAHAGRVLARLGVARHFTAVFDIVAAGYLPKPQPAAYQALIEQHAVEPGCAVFIEDLAQNLAPAAALGMTTVWLSANGHGQSAPPDDDHVHHVAGDLVEWLEGLPIDGSAGER